MIPALRDIPYDLSVRGSPTTVYLHLLNELDPVQWREVKHLALSARLDMHDATIGDALSALTAAGYLERGPLRHGPGASRLYRLVYSKMP